MKPFRPAVVGLSAGAALFVVSTAADANGRRSIKDEPHPLVLSWTGFYVGISGGAAWASSDWDFKGSPVTSMDDTGGIVGGTLGYNWQSGAWVFGVEADLSTGLGLQTHSGSAVFPAACAGGLGCATDIDWLGTVRGRLGYASGGLLLYATGGFAFARVEHSIPAATTNSETATGWTIGAGLEGRLTSNLSAKVEYLFVDLGETTACPASNALCAPPGTLADNEVNILRVGLNYRF